MKMSSMYIALIEKISGTKICAEEKDPNNKWYLNKICGIYLCELGNISIFCGIYFQLKNVSIFCEI